MKIQIQKILSYVKTPKYINHINSTFELYAPDELVIPAGKTKTIRMGIMLDCPEGYELQILPHPQTTKTSNLRLAATSLCLDLSKEIELSIDNIANKSYDDLTIKKDQPVCVVVMSPILRPNIEIIDSE